MVFYMEVGKIFLLCPGVVCFFFLKTNNLHHTYKVKLKHLKRDFTYLIKLQGISLIKHMVTAKTKPVSQIKYAN